MNGVVIDNLEVRAKADKMYIFDVNKSEEIAFDADTAQKLAQYILDVYGPPDEA